MSGSLPARLQRILALIAAPEGGSRRDQRRRRDELRELRLAAATDFGAERGWRFSNRSFGPRTLALGRRIVRIDRRREWSFPHSVGDHGFYYRDGDGRAIGFVSHLYGIPTNLLEWAASEGLIATVIDGNSWWYPNSTTAVVFVRDPDASDRKTRRPRAPEPEPVPAPTALADPVVPPEPIAKLRLAWSRPAPIRPWPDGDNGPEAA